MAASSALSSTIPPPPTVSSDHMCAILGHLEAVFERAVRLAFPQHTGSINSQIQLGRMADYQCNVAMALAKVGRAGGSLGYWLDILQIGS